MNNIGRKRSIKIKNNPKIERIIFLNKYSKGKSETQLIEQYKNIVISEYELKNIISLM